MCFAKLYDKTSMIGRLTESGVILARRAARHDQPAGALARIFAMAAACGTLEFAFLCLVINGPSDPNL